MKTYVQMNQDLCQEVLFLRDGAKGLKATSRKEQ